MYERYIYSEDDSNYTMILDHNTTARIKWNDDNKNLAYEQSNLYAVVEDLKTTSGWKVNPRLITAEEVNTITGKTGWTNTGSWYLFETLTQTRADFSNTRSKYNWLYNNLYQCKTDTTDFGCTIEDNNIYVGYGNASSGNVYGYWTSTTYGNAGSGSIIWNISRDGVLRNNSANDEYARGIRPVITVPKSIMV